MIVSYPAIEDAIVSRLHDASIPDAAALVVTEHLLANEVLGRTSHGLFRLPGIVRAAEATDAMAADITVTQTEPAAWVVDGGQLPGIYALARATQELIGLQEAIGGVTALGVRNYRGTTGSVGLFAWEASRAGVSALFTCNSERAIAAPGGTNPIVGTNPLAFAFPTEDVDQPVVGDYASSAWSYGDIAVEGLRGHTLPEGIVQDSNGQPSVLPSDADKGSMLPNGGHKGFCQSLMVELLCGALVGGKVAAEKSGDDAALLLGFSAGAFGQADRLRSRASLAVEHITQSKRAPGGVPRVPGARYASLLGDSPAEIDVDDVVVARLRGAGVTM